MAELITHLETHLGQITAGIHGNASTPPSVQVATFATDRPFTGVTSLATLGLSRHHLSQPSGRGLQLLLHLPAAAMPRNTAALLFQVAAELVSPRTRPAAR